MIRIKIFMIFFMCYVGIFSLNGQDNKPIFRVLEKFHEGYTHRNTEIIDEWCEKLLSDDMQIMFINAIMPGNREWEFEMAAARRLFKNNWERWGDLTCF